LQLDFAGLLSPRCQPFFIFILKKSEFWGITQNWVMKTSLSPRCQPFFIFILKKSEFWGITQNWVMTTSTYSSFLVWFLVSDFFNQVPN
jgi:hypothetical protein